MISPVLDPSRCSASRRGAAELLLRAGPVSHEPNEAFEAHMRDLVHAGPDCDAPGAYEWTHGTGGAAFDALCFLSSRAQRLMAAAQASANAGDNSRAFHLARKGFEHAASALVLRQREDFIETHASCHDHTSTQTFVRLGHATRGLQSLAMLRQRLDLSACHSVESGPRATRAQALSRAADSAVRDLCYAAHSPGWSSAQADDLARMCVEACFGRLAAHAAWMEARDAPGDVGVAICSLRQATAASTPVPGVWELLQHLEDRNTRLMESVPDPEQMAAVEIDRKGYAQIAMPDWLRASQT